MVRMRMVESLAMIIIIIMVLIIGKVKFLLLWKIAVFKCYVAYNVKQSEKLPVLKQ